MFDHKRGVSSKIAASKFNISRSYVRKLLKETSVLAKKRILIPALKDAQKLNTRAKCGNIYLKFGNLSWILDD